LVFLLVTTFRQATLVINGEPLLAAIRAPIRIAPATDRLYEHDMQVDV
jgi:hypothetical protein